VEIQRGEKKKKKEKPGQGLSSHNHSVSEHCARRGGPPEEMIPSHIVLLLYSENDALYGGKGKTPRDSANGRFLAILKSSREEYKESSSKKTFRKSIMEEWKSQDPPGRFLQRDADTKEWFEIDPKVMSGKIQQRFCELNRGN
jgi:hypothetical protein